MNIKYHIREGALVSKPKSIKKFQTTMEIPCEKIKTDPSQGIMTLKSDTDGQIWEVDYSDLRLREIKQEEVPNA